MRGVIRRLFTVASAVSLVLCCAVFVLMVKTQDVTNHSLPTLLVLYAFAVLPSLWLGLRLARKERVVGLCPACDYDLRASKDRCPECGTPITSKRSARSVIETTERRSTFG